MSWRGSPVIELAAKAAAVAGLCLVPTGCDLQAVKEDLGFGKQAPDEYQVVERAPLSLPPDFHLRPPAPGAPRPQDIDLRKQAQRILMGLSGDKTGGRSPGETAFLSEAGALDADPGIRLTINRESGVYAVETERFVDDLMFWKPPEDENDVIVDPIAEAERLRENAATGLPVTHGESPTIERKP